MINNFTEHEKDIIARYLILAAQQKMQQANLINVDIISKQYVSDLESIGKYEEADELYQFYLDLFDID